MKNMSFFITGWWMILTASVIFDPRLAPVCQQPQVGLFSEHWYSIMHIRNGADANPGKRGAFLPIKVRLAAGTLVVLAAIGYLGFSGIHNFAEYMLPVAGFVPREALYQGQTVRLTGRIYPDSVSYDAARAILRFRLAGGGTTIPVEYHGSVPDNMLQPANNAVVTGMLGSGGIFQASRVLISCPSTYKAVASGTTAG